MKHQEKREKKDEFFKMEEFESEWDISYEVQFETNVNNKVIAPFSHVTMQYYSKIA